MTDREILDTIAKIEVVKGMIKQYEADIDAYKAELEAEMKRRGTNELNVFRSSVKIEDVRRQVLDSKRVKEEAPELYNSYLKSQTFRRMTCNIEWLDMVDETVA